MTFTQWQETVSEYLAGNKLPFFNAYDQLKEKFKWKVYKQRIEEDLYEEAFDFKINELFQKTRNGTFQSKRIEIDSYLSQSIDNYVNSYFRKSNALKRPKIDFDDTVFARLESGRGFETNNYELIAIIKRVLPFLNPERRRQIIEWMMKGLKDIEIMEAIDYKGAPGGFSQLKKTSIKKLRSLFFEELQKEMV